MNSGASCTRRTWTPTKRAVSPAPVPSCACVPARKRTSHISINPFEELRWLEYGQRLATRTRNVTSFRGAHVGRELFERAVEGGAQASGQAIAGLCCGAPADLVALYDDDPMLTGHGDESRLDALVFSGYRLPIEGVMVHGEWLVADGEHRSGAAARETFREAVAAVGAKR